MLGKTDYGGISVNENKGLAKSALFCLCTEINGRKSFPLAYILTAGLKADLFANFVKTCIENVFLVGGIVLSITFDGLRSNLTAMQKLGANLVLGSEEYKPQLQVGTKIIHIIPDASHMVKLVRNTMDRLKKIYNGDGQVLSKNMYMHNTNVNATYLNYVYIFVDYKLEICHWITKNSRQRGTSTSNEINFTSC